MFFQEFTSAQPQLSSTLRNDTIMGFADEQTGLKQKGGRELFFTTSVLEDAELMVDIHDVWLNAMNELQSVPGMLVSLVFQPVTTALLNNSLQRGGNSLDLSVSDGPCVICLIDTIHAGASSDEIVISTIPNLIAQIELLAESRKLASQYRFINYGHKDQKILESYGAASVEKLAAASKKYDLIQFFQKNNPGGYKISQVTG